ncbi:MAG: MoxR family ATPase [Deltaproteobacteria bacterium]|jgi:MoxR-like ATPase|nr:MoxR family ATPase [Deltaproteobacteria bacterium]
MSNIQQQINDSLKIVQKINESISKTVIGQPELKRKLVMALLTDGHVLLEGVPGLAKTLSIKALASAVQGSFQRIQFTPDLLPADLIGTEIYRHQDGMFLVRKGPLFANFILADEINRAPAKVQSALLETMQEKQVTIGNQTYKVPDPFFVLATQNPIEQEGTYPLPEAQIDRFIMKIKVTYPHPEEEIKILDSYTNSRTQDTTDTERTVVSLDDLATIKEVSQQVYTDDKIKQYIMNIVQATRSGATLENKHLTNLIYTGASPRATIALFLCSRALAYLEGSTFVVPQHVKDVAHDVLRHRVILSYEAEAEGLNTDKIISMILEQVPVP